MPANFPVLAGQPKRKAPKAVQKEQGATACDLSKEAAKSVPSGMGLAPEKGEGSSASAQGAAPGRLPAEAKLTEGKSEKWGDLTLSIVGRAAADAFAFSTQKETGYYRGSAGDAVLAENPDAEEGLNGYTGTTSFAKKELTKDANHMFSFDDARLYFNAVAKKSDVVSYGMTVVLSADAGAEKSVRQAFLTFKGHYGHFFLGGASGVESVMAYNAGGIQPGSGGVFGNFLQVYQATSGCNVRSGVVGSSGYANKISFFSPRIHGFQLGASYAPNNQQTGEQKLNAAYSPFDKVKLPFDEKSFAAGVNYVNLFGKLGVSFSLVGIRGDTRPEYVNAPLLERMPTCAFAMGTNISVGNVEFGAEYINNGKNHKWKHDMLVTPTVDGVALAPKYYRADKVGDAHVFDVGVAYRFGKTKVGGSFYFSKQLCGFVDEAGRNNVEATGKIWAFSVEHKVLSGFVPYMEVGFLKTTNADAPYVATRQLAGAKGNNEIGTVNNKAEFPLVLDNQMDCVVMVGAKVKF